MTRRRADGKTKVDTRVVRCAIYARTSSDERLRSDFNSIDAQHAACSAYIESQRAKGWRAIDSTYEDGGFSGKNTDRPALARLLDDIRAGDIDVVVTYKLDRISRSLRDFLQLLSLFETRNVACVSVTQSFDTATPLGRLTMHILLSFAEFEREVIGERIRDKLAASRQRGKWTGGTPILGYDVDRSGPSPKLTVNPLEAARVQQIFELYIELGSLMPVVIELERRGWRTKCWTTRHSKPRGGLAFDKTRLHALLTNDLYVGRVRHKNALHAGEHPALVREELFERVGRQLRQNGRRANVAALRNRHGALLRGLLCCKSCNRAMSHAFTTRGAKRYRYYECGIATKRGRGACPTRSLPAGAIERLVVDELRGIARDPALLAETLAEARRQHRAALQRLSDERRGLERALGRARRERACKSPVATPAALEEQITVAKARLIEIATQLERLERDSIDEAAVRDAFADFDGLWAALTPREQARVVRLLVQRVEFDAAAGTIAVTFSAAGVRALAGGAAVAAEGAA